MHFQTTFVHPAIVKKDERSHTSAESVCAAFMEIDWQALARISCGEDSSDGGINAFYYFEARYSDGAGHEHLLNISGEYAARSEDVLLLLIHMFPIQTISRGLFGLGAPRQKIISEEVHMEGCRPEEASAALAAFVSGDADYLAKHVRDRVRNDD